MGKSADKYRGVPCPDGYRPLNSVEGEVVGFCCIHCGRLSEAPHIPTCPNVGRDATATERFGAVLAALENFPGLQLQTMSAVGELIAQAVAEERKLCAKLADWHISACGPDCRQLRCAEFIAAEIRAHGEVKQS